MRASIRPHGARMTSPRVKLKCMELLPTVADNGSWGAAWTAYRGRNYKARIEKAKALGANSIKCVTSGLTDSGFPEWNLHKEYLKDFAFHLRNNDMRYYTTLTGSDEFVKDWPGEEGIVSRMMHIQDGVKLLMDVMGDLVAGIDLCNEINFFRPKGWPRNPNHTDAGDNDNTLEKNINQQMKDDLSYYLSETRKSAPGVPLSFSVYARPADYSGTGVSGQAGSLMRLQSELGCDFHDIHCYDDWDGSAANVPNMTKFGALEAQPWFIGRHFVGEVGVQNTRTADQVTNFINGMANVATSPRSMGATLFGDCDYYPADWAKFGMYGNAAGEAAFRAWQRMQV